MMMRYFDIVFPQGKKKALTFSFDDGVLQDRRLVAMMNRCGVKGTFNLNSGKFGRKQGDIGFYEHPAMTDILPETEIRTLYAGHEVACHGRYHLPPTMYPSAVMTQEYAADISALERLTGLPVHGGAYANGVLTEETERIKSPDLVFCMENVEDRAADVPMPKLLVHTFIENIFKHAFDGESMLSIFIRARYEAGMTRIVIEDSGTGFSPADLAGNFSAGHVGVTNVRQTLRLLYGRDDLLKLSNNEQGGARVEIDIPDVREGKAV